MVRPLGTALFAVFLSSAFATSASAQSAKPPPQGEAQTVSAMPSATADLQMWSPGRAGPSLGSAPDASRLGFAGRHWKYARRFETHARAAAMQRFARAILRRTSSLALHLTRDALRFIGTPYVFGGTSSAGFDCSGYVQHVYAMLGISLPRTADAQYDVGRPTRGGKAPGDLVFFQTYEAGPSHVGIYLGRGRFIHSSSSRGVMISRISDAYWAARYLGAKRVARVFSLRRAHLIIH